MSKFIHDPRDLIRAVKINDTPDEQPLQELFSTHPDDLAAVEEARKVGLSVDFSARPVDKPQE